MCPVHRNKCHLFQECISFTMAMAKVTYCPNRKSQFHEHLIMGVTSSGVDALSTPPPDAVEKACGIACHSATSIRAKYA